MNKLILDENALTVTEQQVAVWQSGKSATSEEHGDRHRLTPTAPTAAQVPAAELFFAQNLEVSQKVAIFAPERAEDARRTSRSRCRQLTFKVLWIVKTH